MAHALCMLDIKRKTTDTHTYHFIHIGIPLQQRLRERASKLRYTNIGYLVTFDSVYIV